MLAPAKVTCFITTAMTAIGILRELNEWLAAKGHAGRVVFSEAVPGAEVEKAQEVLGVRLPRSYVEFVMSHGVFTIDGDLTGRGSGNDTRLFRPRELAEETARLRQSVSELGDEEGQEVAEDALFFCGDPVDEYFHLFVVSSAHDGDMPTRAYDYQDPACTDPWHEGDGTFDSIVEGIATLVRTTVEKSLRRVDG
jgi:hypothetical protein